MNIKAIGNKITEWGESLVRRLGGRVLAILFASMILALVSVMFTDAWLVELEQQNAQIDQVQRNITVLQQLRTSLNLAESAQRGYLLTQRQELVTTFNQEIEASRRHIRKIEGLFNGQTVVMRGKQEQNWLIALNSTLEAKNAEMKLAISLVQSGKAEEAMQVIKLDQGVIEMARFMQYSQILLDQQHEAQSQLVKKREQTIVITRIALIGTALILLLLVIMVIRQLVQEMNSRDHLRQQLARDCAAYEERIRSNSYMMKTLALDYQSDVERARQKLARDLHDELGSILTATKMDISWTIRRVKDQDPEIVEKLDKTMRYLNQGIQFKRQVVQNLHPSIITTIGFWPALKSLIEDMAERNDWKLDLILPNEQIELPETLGLIAYRVVQESLNNASKYAYATKVSVHMVDALDYLKLEIEDNGVGADLDKAAASTHGLSGIRNRIMAIGGRVDITSAPNQGFHLVAIIPTKL
ncbi:CHASE3 domain-containing protein [Methylobacillus flagellatus]|uniref:sensor histidine kinase n=1 Tax=Methylobacillus flagellatus TaxID=405 RepID=UPI0028540C3E|nr:CHASE3 domain-containing protein [Methylobacillus flagellatus]MDR5171039.1 CHASE3 domain-containing protein [Methylobacillus flagellatus]